MGEEGSDDDLILYNAALSLCVTDEVIHHDDHQHSARMILYSGGALELVDRLGGRVPESG